MTAEWWPLSLSQEAHLIAAETARITNRPHPPAQFPIAMRIQGPLDVEMLESCLNIVIRRHRGLTAAYHPTDAYDERQRRLLLGTFARTRIFIPGLFGQWIYPNVSVKIRHAIANAANDPLDDEHLARIAHAEALTPLDLDSPPVMRASVISFGCNQHLLVLTVSHLAVDGWSAGLLREELIELYAARTSGRSSTLPDVMSHPGEFASTEHRRLRCGELQGHAEYWKRQWTGAADACILHSELPCAIQEPRQNDWSTQVVKRLVIESDSRAVRQFVRDRRITPYVFFRTAFALLLQRCTGRTQVAFWANFANRQDPRFERMIGSCVHPHIMLIDVRPGATVVDLCDQVARRLTEAQRHEHVPEAALPLLGLQRARTHDTGIGFDALPPRRNRPTDSTIEPILVPRGHQWVDFGVRLRDEGAGFALYAAFNERRYSATGVHRLLEHLAQLASVLATSPESRISELTSQVAK